MYFNYLHKNYLKKIDVVVSAIQTETDDNQFSLCQSFKPWDLSPDLSMGSKSFLHTDNNSVAAILHTNTNSFAAILHTDSNSFAAILHTDSINLAAILHTDSTSYFT